MSEDTDLATPGAAEPSDEGRHRDAWTDETAGVDRVISVALTLKQPRTADWIADEAEVSPTTARDHLSRLVDLRVLSAVEQRGAKTYYPDAAYQRFRDVSQLVEEHTREELEQITITAQQDIEELRETYGVESPTELRELATAEETSSAEAREYFRKASEWDRHRHILSIANEAFDRYDEFAGQRSHQPVDSVV